MKKLLLMAILSTGCLLSFERLKAQVSISVNINSQPEWGPEGYDYVEYYYLPDLDIYYDVPNHRFCYQSGGKWLYSSTLPARYQGYNLYETHKVVLNDKNPLAKHVKDKQQYAKFKNQHDQQPIRDSRDDKYSQSKNNWENNRYKNGTSNQQVKGNRANKNANKQNNRRP